ncbi:hypothetical protein D3C73_1448390 [compost metagenome]|jgi:hypothetical protein
MQMGFYPSLLAFEQREGPMLEPRQIYRKQELSLGIKARKRIVCAQPEPLMVDLTQ